MAISPRPKVSYQEYLDLPPDDARTELIDGEVVVSPSPSLRHQRIVRRILSAFDLFLQSRGGGEVLADFDLKISDSYAPRPDLVFVSVARSGVLTERCVDGVPSLVIEVASDSRRHRVEKRSGYEGFGIPEYWVVDPDADRIEVHRLTNRRYPAPRVVEAPETLSPLELPDFELDLVAVFAR